MHPGQIVADRFQIERLAASGGMGAVYRAVDRPSGRVVALKVVRCDSPEDEMRFSREALVLAELNHPGIVQYIAHDVTPAGQSYIAMEWLDGEDLEARIARTGLSVGECVTLGRSIAEALAVLHARGVIHRDIKPSNLFLPGGEIGCVKLLDFGIAQRRGSTGSATRRGALMGTLGYMSPERVRGGQVDPRADVFSLGCVLFECLTRKPAFAAAHMAAVLGKVLFEEPPPVGEICDGVPEEIDRLVTRMLCKDPAGRPADGAAVALELTEMRISSSSARAVLRVQEPSLTGAELCLVSVIAAGELFDADGASGEHRGSSHRSTGAPDRGAPPGSSEPPPPLPIVDLRKVVEPFAAQLESLDGGIVIVTLAGTANAADQAAQAARCALAMRTALGEVPIAMATGRGNLGGRLPIGEAIDRVIDLLRTRSGDGLRASRPGGSCIAVDEITAGLLDDRFEVTGYAAELELLGEREAPLDAARMLLGRPTPYVGRERELSAIVALFDECVSEPRARAVLVTGVAGIGKSRLRYEFLREVARRSGLGAEVWIARCDAIRAGSPFGMLTQLLRHVAGIREGEPVEVRRDKLRASVARRVAPAIAPRVTELLAEIIGAKLPHDDGRGLPAGRYEVTPRGDQLRHAFADFVDAGRADHPRIIVLEDLHWGDRSSVSFIDAALRILRERPLFVLALARAEVHDTFPRLWVDRGVQEIRLEELSRRASARLIREVLGPTVATSTVERVVTQAGGNALYLEELIRAVALPAQAGALPSRGPGKADALPETVLLMVQARLSALTPDARRVLRAASVFGAVFWGSGVHALLGDAHRASEVDAWLTALVDRELIRRRPESEFAGEEEYTFRHELIREAAYGTLTAQDRSLGHRLAGEWLARAGEQDTMVLAEHFERGGEPKRAARLYHSAVAQAIFVNDFDAAIARAQRSAACGAEGELLGAVRGLQAEAHVWRGDVIEPERYGLEAMELLPRESPAWYNAIAAVAVAAQRRGDRGRLATLAEELGAIVVTAESFPEQLTVMALLAKFLLRLGLPRQAALLFTGIDAAPEPLRQLPAVVGHVSAALSVHAALAGEPVATLRGLSAAAESFERAGDRRNAVLSRIYLGVARADAGAVPDVEAELRGALALAEREGIATAAFWVRPRLALVLAQRGAPEEARAMAEEAILDFVLRRSTFFEGAARQRLARILLQMGRIDDAEREVRRSLDVTERLPTLRAGALALLAEVHLARGHAGEAVTAARAALRLLERIGGVEDGEALVRVVIAEALLSSGDEAGAKAAAVAAKERLQARGAAIAEPEFRRRFFDEVPEHARTMELARRLGGDL